jgi:hypothetical protein
MSKHILNKTVRKLIMAAIVHGWCGYVEKANEVVSQQMVLNKLYIPDVLIDIIKDFLYISATEVLRKYYRLHLNLHINDLTCSTIYLQDMYGRDRIAIWRTQTGYYGEDSPEIQLQGGICVECGSCCSYHETLTGCCPLMWDIEGEAQELVERVEELELELELEEVIIPEVTWDISIPTDDAIKETLYADYYEEFDIESQMADYAEYQRELQREEWNGRQGR